MQWNAAAASVLQVIVLHCCLRGVLVYCVCAAATAEPSAPVEVGFTAVAGDKSVAAAAAASTSGEGERKVLQS
jgi:hypothetical protein